MCLTASKVNELGPETFKTDRRFDLTLLDQLFERPDKKTHGIWISLRCALDRLPLLVYKS